MLNLSIPEAFAHVREQMGAVLDAYDIGYIKWDHNRDLLEAATRGTGRAAVHAQTLATYRLMDELKAAHPGLEIESCSSGGARVDLEVLERTDRVWVSDCIDPLDRHQMNRWTSQLVPLELMGSHIASGRSHTTGRLHTLDFRARERPVRPPRHRMGPHAGERGGDRRAALLDPPLQGPPRHCCSPVTWSGRIAATARCGCTGVVSPQRDRALFIARRRRPLATVPSTTACGSPAWTPSPSTGSGRSRPTPAPASLIPPRWIQLAQESAEDGGLLVPGAVLIVSGLATPLLDPEQALLIDITRARGLLTPTRCTDGSGTSGSVGRKKVAMSTATTSTWSAPTDADGRTIRSWRCCSSRPRPSASWCSSCGRC